MIKFEQLYCGSDFTGPYRVDISLPMTVREFIDEILTDHQSEWGYIGIYKEGAWFGDPLCEYKHGELLYSLPEEYLDKQIEKVSGSGGWSRSDFILHLAKEIVEESPKDQYKADMVSMLEEIQMEIIKLPVHVVSNIGSIIRMEIAPSAKDASMLIQQKIDKLKEK